MLWSWCVSLPSCSPLLSLASVYVIVSCHLWLCSDFPALRVVPVLCYPVCTSLTPTIFLDFEYCLLYVYLCLCSKKHWVEDILLSSACACVRLNNHHVTIIWYAYKNLQTNISAKTRNFVRSCLCFCVYVFISMRVLSVADYIGVFHYTAAASMYSLGKVICNVPLQKMKVKKQSVGCDSLKF